MDYFDKTENICRICLVQNSEQTQSVFDTIDSRGEPQQFSKMLMTFAKVEIISGDELPDRICSICAQKTIKLYLFKIQCEESDKTLRNHFKEGPFIVIDKIDIDEVDIFNTIKSEIKEENVEVCDVLKESGSDSYCVQQSENNPLDTIVYKDYDACTSSKYSESLNTFNNDITTESTSSSTDEFSEDDSFQEKDIINRKKIAEITKKRIDQKCESQKDENNKEKSTKNDEVKSLVICLEDCNKMSSLKSSIKIRKDKKQLHTSGKQKIMIRRIFNNAHLSMIVSQNLFRLQNPNLLILEKIRRLNVTFVTRNFPL